MDNFSDPALRLKYNKSKLKVKLWESEFRKKTGNKPSKDDIKEAPCEIREAYKWYWQIKIHALGQDSLLDATFDEKGNTESSTTNNVSGLSADEVPVPKHDSSTISVASNSDHESSIVADSTLCPETTKLDSSTLSVTSYRGPEPLSTSNHFSACSNQEFQVPKLDSSTIEIASNSVPEPSSYFKESLEEQPSGAILKGIDQTSTDQTNGKSSNVWGSHLNKHKSLDAISTKKVLNRSSSFHLSEKLFVGAKFKKRNPRKSLSFSSGRLKDKSSFGSTDSLHVPSDSSFSLDNSQGLDDGFPISDLQNVCNTEPPTSFNDQKFILIKKNNLSNVQPVNAVHKLMEENTVQTKPKIERSLDKGWLDRVMQADQLLIQEVRDNSDQAASKVTLDDSDDDFIYGSDNESKSPRKAEREDKARLALCPTVNKEPSLNVAPQNFKDNFETAQSCEEPQVNPKKRKLDAIEAAMAVLSERRKSDRKQLQPCKKARKSVTLSQNKQSCNDAEVDENCTDPNSVSKKKTSSKMLKSDVMEKKVASGSINDNFVRINIQKKVFVRGKKTMNFQKYKKQQWKNKKKELSNEASAYRSRMDPSDSAAGGGLQKCFKCGDVGHFSRQCQKMKGDSLMPQEEDEDDSPFPSLEEVEKMAKEKSGQVHIRTRINCKAVQIPTVSENVHPSSGVCQSKTSESLEVLVNEEEPSNSDINNEDDGDVTSIMSEPVQHLDIKFGTVQPLYPLQEDGTVMPTPQEVYDCLHKFGHKAFRPGQEEAVMRILSGLPTLVTLSTGSGKSLCYQLAAYLYACKRNSITLVVSPLVSLMDDQISGLPSFIHGAALHTSQTEKQREKVMEMAKSGKLHFLIVSPEAVVAGEKRTGFGSLLRSLPDIAFACIDEAHCVSQWSHNFRPSYLVIFKVLREKLGVRTVLGLTATATQKAVTSIIDHMNIPDGRRGVIQDIPLPSNLLLTVSRDPQRDNALVRLVSSTEFQNYNSVIVYATRREECERLAALLRTCLKNPTQAATEKRKLSTLAEAYHAGLSSARRKQVQTLFMSGELRIVVATVAFGMGIDKADIRSVVHFNMPCNFESYVQEVGRAGRDGQASHCHLFLNSEGKDMHELRRHIFADSVDRHTIRKLLQRVFLPCKCSKNFSGTSQELDSSICKEVEGECPVKGIKTANLADPDDCHKINILSCPGHEVAFSIEQTVSALDLPEENITTLLCYLELHDKNLLQVLPKGYTHCKVQSYKGMKHIRDVARSCPPLAMAIAMDLMSGNTKQNSQVIEFPVIDIASTIGWDSGVVKRELMNLEWSNVNGNSRRSGIKVEFSDLGFRVKAPGNLSPEKLDAALDFLHDRVVKQEQSALIQLHTIFRAVTSVSFRSVESVMECDVTELEAKANELKRIVRAYFQEHNQTTVNLKSEEKLENGEQIANDTRQLVTMYRDCSFTGRAVARIFHGISSPNFPAQVWARCRFWRLHLESDFKLICLLATRVLLKMR